jgi:hypothetical protein
MQRRDASLSLAPPRRRLLTGTTIRPDSAGGSPLQPTQLTLRDFQVLA